MLFIRSDVREREEPKKKKNSLKSVALLVPSHTTESVRHSRHSAFHFFPLLLRRPSNLVNDFQDQATETGKVPLQLNSVACLR